MVKSLTNGHQTSKSADGEVGTKPTDSVSGRPDRQAPEGDLRPARSPTEADLELLLHAADMAESRAPRTGCAIEAVPTKIPPSGTDHPQKRVKIRDHVEQGSPVGRRRKQGLGERAEQSERPRSPPAFLLSVHGGSLSDCKEAVPRIRTECREGVGGGIKNCCGARGSQQSPDGCWLNPGWVVS